MLPSMRVGHPLLPPSRAQGRDARGHVFVEWNRVEYPETGWHRWQPGQHAGNVDDVGGDLNLTVIVHVQLLRDSINVRIDHDAELVNENETLPIRI
jgi:hypothetical protein